MPPYCDYSLTLNQNPDHDSSSSSPSPSDDMLTSCLFTIYAPSKSEAADQEFSGVKCNNRISINGGHNLQMGFWTLVVTDLSSGEYVFFGYTDQELESGSREGGSSAGKKGEVLKARGEREDEEEEERGGGAGGQRGGKDKEVEEERGGGAGGQRGGKGKEVEEERGGGAGGQRGGRDKEVKEEVTNYENNNGEVEEVFNGEKRDAGIMRWEKKERRRGWSRRREGEEEEKKNKTWQVQELTRGK